TWLPGAAMVPLAVLVMVRVRRSSSTTVPCRVASRLPERRVPAAFGTPVHPERAMLPARRIQVFQRLLQHVRRRRTQPRMLTLRLGQLPGLLRVVHPPATFTVLTTLGQTGVPHRPAHVPDLFGIRGLLTSK